MMMTVDENSSLTQHKIVEHGRSIAGKSETMNDELISSDGSPMVRAQKMVTHERANSSATYLIDKREPQDYG